MKKQITLVIAALVISMAAIAQAKDTAVSKTDTSYHIVMKQQEIDWFIQTLNNNVDSKKVTEALMQFIRERLQLVADKPKKEPKK